MSDDIVTRLRNAAAGFRIAVGTNDAFTFPTLHSDAADEIERLQKLVTTWIICAERLVESIDGEAYEKALAFYLDCQRIANETC